ncbi:hypothetical protein FRB99_005306 [Tulasnella sp. 403]|nr:hypothetical protein FRB99_005306 [Tulasnella sp. 403]
MSGHNQAESGNANPWDVVAALTQRQKRLERSEADVTSLEDEVDALRQELERERAKRRQTEHQYTLCCQTLSSTRRELELTTKHNVSSLAQARSEAENWKTQFERVNKRLELQSQQLDNLMSSLNGYMACVMTARDNARPPAEFPPTVFHGPRIDVPIRVKDEEELNTVEDLLSDLPFPSPEPPPGALPLRPDRVLAPGLAQQPQIHEQHRNPKRLYTLRHPDGSAASTSTTDNDGVDSEGEGHDFGPLMVSSAGFMDTLSETDNAHETQPNFRRPICVPRPITPKIHSQTRKPRLSTSMNLKKRKLEVE